MIQFACMVFHLVIIKNRKSIINENLEDKIMTSKQRAYLKGLAMNLDPVFQIGKSSVTPENIVAISEVFHTHELIKIAVLKNCIDDPKEIANTVAERTHSQVVQVIGKKFVLYKPFKENPKIVLPK